MYEYNFISPITDESITKLIDFIHINKTEIDILKINISSSGGSVPASISAYNYLKGMSFKVITNNIGEVSSSAILLYLSGSIRLCSSIAKFLIHPMTVSFNGEYNYYQILQTKNILEKDINNYINILNFETNCLHNLYSTESLLKYDSIVLSYEEAHKCGIVTDISINVNEQQV